MMEFSQLLGIFLSNWEVVMLFFFIAILYSSVGFGGGSSYLAILAVLTTIGFIQIRALALLCNIVVVSGGTYLYAKYGYYKWKKVLPLVLMSVPMAFIGGYLKINEGLFFVLLASVLIIAAVLMWISKYLISIAEKNDRRESKVLDATFGGLIGFLAGMVGIGGGIFLAPLLYLTNWDTPKRIAATTSFFILVNSIAGLFGQIQNARFELNFYLAALLMTTVFLGGQIGTRLSVSKVSPFLIKRITALLIAFVGIRILINQFY